MSERSRRKERVIPFIYMLYGVTTVFMLVFSMLLFVHNAYAATNTTINSVKGMPGAASLSDPQILVKSTFSDEDLANLFITYKWKIDDGDDDFSTPLGTYSTGTSPVSPYQYAITGLDNSQTYRVLVEFDDSAVGTFSTVLTNLKTYNPFIHNAVSTGSNEDLWTGGWGISSGQYGEFSCSTCHERKSGNIKRIRKDWSDPALPPVQAALNDATVIFNSTTEFAKDDSSDHSYVTADGRICESCHTRTAHHQCDMADDDSYESELDHKSSMECVDCHKHSAGFAIGGCSTCHGGSLSGSNEKNFWPDNIDETVQSGSISDSGEHLAHIAVLAQREYGYTVADLLNSSSSQSEQMALCNYCHANPGRDADHAENTTAETRFLQIYNDAVTDVDAAFTSGSCSQIDCHNNNTVNVSWYGDINTSCTMCHTTGGTVNPTSGLHDVTPSVTGQRHDSSISGGCEACHTSLALQATHIDGTAQDGSGQEAQMGLATFYTQTADDTGSCSNTNCHLEVNGGADGSSDDWAHVWDSTATFYTDATTACAGCHGDWANNWNSGITHRTTAGTSAKHGTGTSYKCKDCHNLEASSGYTFTFSSDDWNPASGETSTHGDGQIQVNNVTGYNTGTGYCVNCHTSGTYNFSDTAWAVVSVAGDAITTSCGECHKGGAAPGSISESHVDHGIIDADITDGGAECVICHGNNLGGNYQNTLADNHGNNTIDLLNTRITAYSGGLVKWDASESTCTNSCHATDANPVWDTTATLACDQCHYYEAAPVSANNTGAGALNNSHDVHFNAAAVTVCIQCHPDNSGETAPYGHIDGTTLLEKSREAIVTDNADMTPLGADFNDGANTCSNASCHDPSDDGHVSTAWGTANASCQMCHSSTDPGSGSHTEHIDASASFGVTINCDSCHPAASGRDHMNLSKDVEISYNSVVTTVVNSATLNGCGTNDCHNDGTSLVSGTPADYTWGTPITDCQECHDATAATLASNAHNEHLDNGYTTVACTDCHTAATATTHINQSVNIDSGEATYSLGAAVVVGTTPDGTCATTSCHNQGGGDSVAWNVPAGDTAGTQALTCDSCHYFNAPATSAENTAHFAALSSSHGDHFDSGKVCTQCHGNLPTTTAHIDNKSTLADGAVALQDEAGMDWTHASAATDYSLAADNSCGSATNNGLGCHATGTPDWDVSFDSSVCTNCHTNTTTSEVNPTSGLHGATNLLKHDDLFNTDKTCTSCHDASSPSSAHMNGTLQDGGTVTYTWDTTYMAAGYVRATDDCAATCHTDGGTWNREWSGAEDVAWTYSDNAASAAVCGNCHGTFVTGWNIVGSTSHDNPDVDNNPDTLADSAGSHGTCSTCHAWGHANYIGANDKHENGLLEMNSTLDSTPGDGNCTTTCHVSLTLTMDANSGWTDAFVAGDGVTCGGCHIGGVTPGSATGAHAIHNADNTDLTAESGADCVNCHGAAVASYTTTLIGTHGDDTVDFSGVTYSQAASRGDLTGTCSTTSCHNQGSDPSTSWDSSALACDDCHYYEATVVNNANNAAHTATLSNRHDSHLNKAAQCSNCHTIPAAEDTSHIDGTTNLIDMATAAFGEAAVGGSKTVTYTNPTCSANFGGLGCHATSTSEAWNQAVDTIACTDCHTDTSTAAVNPTSGLHATNNLTDHDATLSGGSGNPCEKCHTAAPSSSHVDGTLDTPVIWNTAIIPAGYVSGTDSCAASCHSDSGTWNRRWDWAKVNDVAWTYADDASSATVCGNCHGSFATGWNIVGSTSHDNPDTDNDPDTLATSKDIHNECSSCHAWGHTNYIGVNDKHVNDLLEMNSTLDTTPGDGSCTTTCHGGQTLTMAANSGWTDASVAGDDVKCSACHGGGMNGSKEDNFWPDSGVKDVDNAGSEDDEGEHVIHMTHLALRDGMTLQNLLDDANSKVLQIGYCERCHGANAGSSVNHLLGDDVGDVGAFEDMDGTADDMAPAGSYSSGTCSNIDCHNNQNQASPGWYAGVNNAPCTMCHNSDGNNGGNPVKVDPTSGLHYASSSGGLIADSNGALLHDNSFTGGGNCLSCHTVNPSNMHVDGTVQTPDQTTFNFLIDASIDVKLNNLADATDDTCAANCHADNKQWYRFWSANAFDATPFDTTSLPAINSAILNDLPPNCNVCHGEFKNGWAEGTAHYNMEADNTSSGASHNSQNPNINPGAACVDCHLYPDHMTPGQGLARHENGMITLTDDQAAPDEYTPTDDSTGARVGVYCSDCHENTPGDGIDSNTFEYSTAFPSWSNVEVVPTDRNPEYTCFSGANGCHGDTSDNWWPHLDQTDPFFFPNRAGAHYEHGTTIGELLAAQVEAAFPGSRSIDPKTGRAIATQDDRNKTCNFCHPMAWNATRGVWESLYHRANTPGVNEVVVDVYGGYKYSLADKTGNNVSGNPSIGGDSWVSVDNNPASGFLYQLEEDPFNPGSIYPVDTDGTYYQYLNSYNSAINVRTGVCSNVACHSNSPFTPQWYGDHQAPGQIADLTAFTDNQDASVHDTYEWDEPGSVHLYWTAPGDNGDFDGKAEEYDVYYRLVSDGPITDNNLPGAAGDDGKTERAGGAATVLRQGEAQEMNVKGLTPGVDYNFAIVTMDEPHYEDDDSDGIFETLHSASNHSTVSNNANAVAHLDNVAPIFYGVSKIHPHDEEKVVNLSWESARDHTMPISYRLWYSTWSLKTHLAKGGDLTEVAEVCYEEGTPPTEVSKGTTEDYCIESDTTTAIHFQEIVPNAGDLYSFLVRAYDGAGNHDDNTVVQMVLPKAAPMEQIDTEMYIYNGSNLVEQADVGNPSWPGSGSIVLSELSEVVWQTNTTLSRESMVSGISFDAEIVWGSRDIMDLTAELGYMDGSFKRLGPMTDLEVQNNALVLTRRVTRLAKFSLANYKGLVPANKPLALRLKRWDNTARDITINFGDSATKGQLLANVQPYNHEPNGTFAIQLNSPTVRPGGYIDIDWVAADPQDAGQTIHYDIYGSADNGASYPYVIATNVDDTDLNGAEYGKVTWDTVGDGLTESYNCKIKVELGDGYQYEDPDLLVNPGYPDPFEYNSATFGSTDWITHNVYESATIPLNNILDVEPPAAVTLHSVETRPKQGSVYLAWTAVGDDGLNHGTRVSYYDIRYVADPEGVAPISDGNWDTATQVEGEPVPNFSGSLESFELLGLAPMMPYDIGIKACDEADNCSDLGALSTSEGWRTDEGLSAPIHGGPFYCGICHSTPPDEPETKGVHRQHGYTLDDCAKCHGDGNGIANDVRTYDGRHYNGFIDIGWAKNSDGTHAPLVQIPIENGGATDVVITQVPDTGSVTIYQDLSDGPGGYNKPSGQTSTATAYTDSGTCMNFGGANANGCHGPFQPQWAPSVANPNPAPPECSDCHGDKTMVVNDDSGTGFGRLTDPYGRQWDCVDESLPQIEDPPSSGNFYSQPSELVKASPPTDNHGESAKTDKYTGAHLRHLNSSFRFAKGDSCRLCHKDTMYSGLHADGKVDVIFDDGANQSQTLIAGYQFDGPEATTGMSCGSLSTDSCHDTFEADGVTPKILADWPVWNEPGAQCDSCHGMSTMGAVPHISDGVAQSCDYCHLAGHPQSPDGITAGDPDALLINNNPAVGINYKSGGIHLRKVIGGRTNLNSGEPIDTLAEICWGCHEDNSISEWDGDDTPLNATVEPYSGVGRSMYDFGSLNITSWYADTTPGSEIGATWSSAETNYSYKTGRIQSTHSTDPTGVATVTWDPANGRYNETMDSVDKIRCTNCHDVHDLNKADGDTVSGAPYLRGTWKSNPYEEDGAPWNKTGGYTTPALPTPGFGPYPRAATTYFEKGGYFIDQNNVRPGTTTVAKYPTSGWTVASSAGLCVLCHDSDVDGMDKNQGEGLWLGTNGHSNSALGGTFVDGENIFDYTHGRPIPNNPVGALGSEDRANIVADMAMQTRTADTLDASEDRVYGYRSTAGGSSNYLDPLIDKNYAYNNYQWGATIDDTITDVMYHQFSCSKCHNPHASRLPKLMITNCLDIRHNTWDDSVTDPQNSFTNATNDRVDRGMPAAYYASAQNCHRFDAARGDENNDNTYEDRAKRGGWNKVTPWVKDNLNNNEHKGSTDPAYGTSNTTSPWRHSDFPTEPTGW